MARIDLFDPIVTDRPADDRIMVISPPAVADAEYTKLYFATGGRSYWQRCSFNGGADRMVRLPKHYDVTVDCLSGIGGEILLAQSTATAESTTNKSFSTTITDITWTATDAAAAVGLAPRAGTNDHSILLPHAPPLFGATALIYRFQDPDGDVEYGTLVLPWPGWPSAAAVNNYDGYVLVPLLDGDDKVAIAIDFNETAGIVRAVFHGGSTPHPSFICKIYAR